MPDISDSVRKEIEQWPKAKPSSSGAPYMIFSYETDGTQVTAVHLARRVEIDGIVGYMRDSGIKYDEPEDFRKLNQTFEKRALHYIADFFRKMYTSLFQ